jgi:pyruvate dehydrogenase E1 component alpha subunit
MPVERQTATKTIAEKASAYAIEGVRVDGNDIFAVYKTVQKYADAARKDFKPALIELVTYRMGDHTTADDASRYRTKEILSEWEKKDPIDRMQKYLLKKGSWTKEKDKELEEECSGEVEKAVREYEAIEQPDPADMFKFIYREMPWHLKEQMDELKEIIQEGREK